MPDEREANDARMLARALRFYSDHCEPGNLHADCPYSVLTRDGLGCGEECLDYLAAHQENEGTREADRGVRFIPLNTTRRFRRGPDPEAPAYDCRQLRIEERELSPARQSPTTLLLRLADAFIEPPHTDETKEAERRSEISTTTDELTRRGFSVDRLIAAAIVPLMAQSVVLWAIVTAIAGEDLPPGWSYHTRSKWVPLLLDHFGFTDNASLHVDLTNREGSATIKLSADAETAEHVKAMLTTGPGKAVTWMAGQSIDALITSNAPTLAEFEDIVVPSDDPTKDTLQRWIFERFTSTYLESWATTSLEHEWQYLHGRQTPPCNPGQLGLRRIDARRLAMVIADRTTSDRDHRSNALTISKYVGVAADLLASGQRTAAAQIFDMACSLSPDSGEAHNNRGFCRLPDDPETALIDFAHARALGVGDPLITAANQCLALHKLGRNASALKIAADVWPSDMVSRNSATMWDFRATTASLSTVDSQLYLAELAAEIAERSGDIPAATVWIARADERRQYLSKDDTS